MNTRDRNKFVLTLVALAMAVIFTCTVGHAAILTTDLSIHYRADDVDNLGNPGIGGTTTLVNLANPGTHDGTIVNGTGITQNGAQTGTPYEYGVTLTGASETHIEANTFQIGGDTNKVTSGTWEYWLRADSDVANGRGALYGEFPASGGTRHYLRLEGIGTTTRTALYDEFPPFGGGVQSDSQLYETGEFTQIVVTKSGDTLTFYKDGEQLGSTKTHSESYTGPGPDRTYFGARGDGGISETFDGQFNIVRVYDDVLTPDQIKGNFIAEAGVDFSDAVTAGDLTVNNPNGPHTLTMTDPNAGTYTVTITGTPNTGYNSDRGGGFRNESTFGQNDQTWNFAVSGLAAGYEITDFGVGYVYGEIISASTFDLDVDAGGPTLASISGINSPAQPNQTNNDMFGVPTGNYGAAPTFSVLIDQNNSSPSVLQLNGLRITVSAIVVPEPSTFVLAALGLLGLLGFRRRRNR